MRSRTGGRFVGSKEERVEKGVEKKRNSGTSEGPVLRLLGYVDVTFLRYPRVRFFFLSFFFHVCVCVCVCVAPYLLGTAWRMCVHFARGEIAFDRE